MNPQEQAYRNPQLNPLRAGMLVALFVSSLFSMPAEMLYRRNFGTRYFGPAVLVISSLMFTVWTAIATALGSAQGKGIGVGILCIPFLLVSYYHTGMIVYRVATFKEAYSYHDGDSWLPWDRLNYGNTWAMVRLVYEPLSMLALALLLAGTGLVSFSMIVFLVVSAFALAIKAAFLFYFGWESLRDLLDQRWLAKNMRGALKPAQAAQAPMSLAQVPMPKNLPPSVQTAVLKRMEDMLPEEYKAMLSPVEPEPTPDPTPPTGGPDNGKEKGPDTVADLSGLLTPVTPPDERKAA